ncbi:MAG: hypothetical protein GXZ13_07745, partial [Synergistaceae bacterium]|nr:hypothetical protein [Synergistaceae bacterium]
MRNFLKRFLVFLLIYALTLNGFLVSFAGAVLVEIPEEEEILHEEDEGGDVSSSELGDTLDEDGDIEEDELGEIVAEEVVDEFEVTEEDVFEIKEEDEDDGEEFQLMAAFAMEEEPEEGPRSLSASAGRINVEIIADEGVLEPGSSLRVSLVDDSAYKDNLEAARDKTFNRLKVLDIELLDKDGQGSQPSGSVQVLISGLAYGREVEAYYLGQSQGQAMMRAAQASIEPLAINISAGGLSFWTDHFSIYALADIATAEYNFYSGGVLVDSQIVQDGEYLLEPELAAEEGKNFKGWILESETVAFDFGTAISVLTSGSYRLDADFDEGYFVYFNYAGSVITTKKVQPGQAVNDSGVSLVIDETGKAFEHWSLSEGGLAYDFNQAVNSDLNLYAVLSDRWKVSFDSQGGSQVLPKYVVGGQALGSLISPQRVGYTFMHWNSQANGGGSVISSSTLVNGDMSAYAIWTPKTVNYSLVYWKENANDSGYTYEKTVTKSGLTGNNTSLSSSDKDTTMFEYFSFSHDDGPKVIKGDGSTIVNVYYSRKIYKVEFVLIPSSGTRPATASMTIGGNTYTHNGTKYSFQAKYDSDISDKWPTASNVPNVTEGTGNNKKTYLFQGWSHPDTTTIFVSKRMDLTPNLFNANGTTKVFTGVWSENLSLYTLHYMIENLPGDTGGQLYSGKYYTEDPKYSQTAYASGNWSAKELKGVKHLVTDQKSDGNVYFYYERRQYDLDFFNPNFEKKEKYLFGASIASANYTPNRPSGVGSDYVFSGWFTTPNFTPGTEFDFAGKVMPEHNIALYAKWAPPVRRVQYYLDPANSTLASVENIPHGSSINEGQLVGKVIPNGLIEGDFLGWFWYVDGVFVKFDFDLPIERDDIILYPVWNSPDYSVSYEAGEGSGPVPVDNKDYKLGSAAKIMSRGAMSHSAGKVFLGWKEKDGSAFFYPGDRVNIEGNLVLEAVWGPRPETTSLIYDGNGGLDGVDSQIVLSMPNNSSHQVRANTFIKEGHDFIGWNVRSDGSGAGFAPGSQIVLDNKGPQNFLYAQWRKKSFTVDYLAASGGSILGSASQTVSYGGSTEEVQAKADAGYYFVDWDDGSDQAIRHEEDVKTDAVYTARFARKAQLEVTANSASKVYDGQVLSDSGFSQTGLKTGDSLEVVISGSITNVGSVENKVDSVKVMRDGLDVSHEYVITKVDGTLEIFKRSLEITAGSASKIFDGSPLTDNSHQITVGSLATGQTIESILITGSQTAVGTSANVASGAVIKEGTQDVSANYEITYLNGILKVLGVGISIDKEYEDLGSGLILEGHEIHYTIRVTNIGEVTLTNILVNDPLLEIEDYFISSLAPGISHEILGVYEIKQTDLDRGMVVNEAFVTGKDPDGNSREDETEIETPLEQVAEVEIIKTSVFDDLNGNGRADAGDNIIYSLLVQNLGNVSLFNLEVSDPFLGLVVPIAELAPGESEEISHEYLLEQEDLDAGQIHNIASVEGQDPDGGKVQDEDEDLIGFESSADLTSSKKGVYVDANGDGKVNFGDKIDYAITIENTGNITLHNISVVDTMIGLDGQVDELAPGEKVFFTGSYFFNQDDLDSGRVINQVELEVDEIEDPDQPEDEVDLEHSPGIEIEKSAEAEELSKVGDKIVYTIVVRNTGNVTLKDVEVKDGLVDLDELIDKLAPGESASFSVDYEITQADLDKGQVLNKATVTAKDPDGEDHGDQDEEETELDS